MKKKITGIPQQDTGVGFYRIIQPIRSLTRTGLYDEGRMIPFTGNFEMQQLSFNDKTLMEISKDSEAILTTLIWDDSQFLKMMNLRKWSGAKWIVDIDDNIYAVSRDNAGYAWSKLNKDRLERTLRLADGLTVSVPTLKRLYAELNPNIYVNPNSLDFYKPYKNADPQTGKGAGLSWEELRLTKKKHKGIRIGWRGASGHKEDVALIEPVMRAISAAFPEVTWVFFTQTDPKYDFKYEHHDWVGLLDFPEKLASLNLDLAVVPLVDSSYNRCKSNLAFLEYSALEIPTVMSPTENQKALPALYATTNYEWFEAIKKLITDKELRLTLGKEANTYIKKYHDMSSLAKPLSEWIRKLPRRTDLEPEDF